MTWEEAVSWLRSQPDRQNLVRDCFFDDPLTEAAERFRQSEEWQAVTELLAPYIPGKVLDLGAGRGISTYAFARQGCRVTALEPDPSALVGRGAITALLRQTGLEAEILAASGEELPCPDAVFDVVYGRAVLHHARDLEQLCREVARILRPHGVFLVTREHVLSRQEDLRTFLDGHPLHALYGGENAYTLERYLAAIRAAGLKLTGLMGPFDTPMNYAPMRQTEVRTILRSRLARLFGHHLAERLLRLPVLERALARMLSARCHIPGRHYSFLACKP